MHGYTFTLVGSFNELEPIVARAEIISSGVNADLRADSTVLSAFVNIYTPEIHAVLNIHLLYLLDGEP